MLTNQELTFYKYQSLGNDFVLFDWLDKIDNTALQNSQWPNFVRQICNRNYGVGADGVLIVKKQHNQIEGLIFNSDGSKPEKCLNGLRCIAHYLVNQKQFPSKLNILMKNVNVCTVENNEIIANIGKANYQEKLSLKINNQTFIGHKVDVGNPHFVIDREVSLEWLKKHGADFSEHKLFPHRTNVEFVWPIQQQEYNLLIYERGCGVTNACGTGAAATLQTLFQLGKITRNKKIIFNMPGGKLQSYLENDGSIIQIASAAMIFSGKYFFTVSPQHNLMS